MNGLKFTQTLKVGYKQDLSDAYAIFQGLLNFQKYELNILESDFSELFPEKETEHDSSENAWNHC